MSDKVGVRINIPYLQGAYLAFNAIPDAFFLGDGPSCIFAKGEHIVGPHDLFSTLLSCDNNHRVQHTGVNVFTIAGDCEGQIASALRGMAETPGCGVVFFGSMPMCAIAGTDYERILRETLKGNPKPAFLMPRSSAISGDWLDGYSGVLEAMAKGMDLSGAKPDAKRVAIVGYLMDRNEGDHHGNVKELERMVRALGLEPASIWLSGRPYEGLREARHAGAVISLPHGRKAAKTLAGRLGVKLIDAELPFGLEASRRFMERLGKELKRGKQAADFIKSELDAVAPKLAFVVPHSFLNRRFVFAGDPQYAPGFVEQLEDLGAEIPGLILLGGAHHLLPEQKQALAKRPGTLFEPLQKEFAELWATGLDDVDLIIGNGFFFREARPGHKRLEFGFTSEFTHFLRDEPFLGFQGALGFLNRLSNELVKGLCVDQDNPPQARRPRQEPQARKPARSRR